MSETLTNSYLAHALACRAIDRMDVLAVEGFDCDKFEQDVLDLLNRHRAPPPDLSALAAEIMNLPRLPGPFVSDPPNTRACYDPDAAYEQGHLDAIRAAAALILSRLTPAAGVDALYPDNLNADLAHRLSCVAHDCCVNGRMRHDVGLKLVRVVRDFMRLVHSPAAPEAAAERVYEWQGRRCKILGTIRAAEWAWIGDGNGHFLDIDGQWKSVESRPHYFRSDRAALAFLETLTKKGTP